MMKPSRRRVNHRFRNLNPPELKQEASKSAKLAPSYPGANSHLSLPVLIQLSRIVQLWKTRLSRSAISDLPSLYCLPYP